MTGEQLITKGSAWQRVLNATGAIILQNQSSTYSVQYHIGTVAPVLETAIADVVKTLRQATREDIL